MLFTNSLTLLNGPEMGAIVTSRPPVPPKNVAVTTVDWNDFALSRDDKLPLARDVMRRDALEKELRRPRYARADNFSSAL